MGILNRRNAVIGWAVVKLGRRAARKKAKRPWERRPAMPERAASRGAFAAGVAAAIGAIAFWQRRRSSGDGTAD